MSAATATALLSAPVAFADHGDRDDQDRHEDRHEVQVAPAQPRVVVEIEQEQEVNDLFDDD